MTNDIIQKLNNHIGNGLADAVEHIWRVRCMALAHALDVCKT